MTYNKISHLPRQWIAITTNYAFKHVKSKSCFIKYILEVNNLMPMQSKVLFRI